MEVVVPPHSSVFSASGAAGLERLHIYEQSVWMVLFNPLIKQLFSDFDRFNAIVDDFHERAVTDFGGQGFVADDIRTAVELDVRSTGQLYVITIASPVSRLESQEDLAAIIKAYFTEYGDRFGDLALTKDGTLDMTVVEPAGRADDPDVVELRWMLEEYRVSLFAQELRTAYPVSDKRIMKALEAVKKPGK
jgi:N-methylhydantoinase A/oxoprolinase/acetone carboxylase beta subunit